MDLSSKSLLKVEVSDLQKLVSQLMEDFSVTAGKQRRNIACHAGLFYPNQRRNRWISRDIIFKNIPDSPQSDVLISQNFLPKVIQFYTNVLSGDGPLPKCVGRNKSEIQDSVSAEIANAVWSDILEKSGGESLVSDSAFNLALTGEIGSCIKYNPSGGRLVGLAEDGTGLFSGSIEIEPIPMYNLLCDPAADSMEKSSYYIVTKVVSASSIYEAVGNPEVREYLKKNPSSSEDLNKITPRYFNRDLSVSELNNHFIAYYVYKRPDSYDPMGAYAVFVKDFMIYKGQLPGGIMPINVGRFSKIQNDPRGYSEIIETALPFQMNINRMVSKHAQIQQTFGDTKVIHMGPGSLSEGSNRRPGMRVWNQEGLQPPVIIQGEYGTDLLPNIESEYQRMLQALRMNIPEDRIQSTPRTVDAMSFISLRQKGEFRPYKLAFNNYWKNVCMTALDYARFYYEPGRIIESAGRDQSSNLSVFLNGNPLDTQVKVIPSQSDLDSDMLKATQIREIIQFVGDEHIDKAQLAGQYPMLSKEESLQGIDIKSKIARNMIIALDEGRDFEVGPYHDLSYLIRRLELRISGPDFGQLPEEIKSLYQEKINMLQQIHSNQMQQKQFLEDGGMPLTGPRVRVPFLVKIPGKDGLQRAEVPIAAIGKIVELMNDKNIQQQMLFEDQKSIESQNKIQELSKGGQGG